MKNLLSVNEFVQKLNFFLGENKKEIAYKKYSAQIYHLEEFSKKGHEDFIENLYQILLQRSSDLVGKTSKVNELENGKSRRDVVHEMISCEEGQAHKDKYHFLGLRKIEPVTISFLNQKEYNESEYGLLNQFFTYKFSIYKFSNTILDLLEYSGAEFVFLAYLLFLKRQPDIEGFHAYLPGAYLLSDKLKIIFDLAHSQESKDKKVEIVDLQGNLISSIASEDKIEYIKISEQVYHKLVHNYLKHTDEHRFSRLLDGNTIEQLCFLSNQSNNPLEAFEYITDLLFNKHKPILSYLYDEYYFMNRKEQYTILDFFNKPHLDTFSLIDDYIPNNSFYISWKSNKDTELIHQFNNFLLYKYIDEEMGDLIGMLKTFAFEDDLRHLHNNQLNLLNDIEYIEKMIIEHEEALLNMVKTPKTTNKKHKGRK